MSRRGLLGRKHKPRKHTKAHAALINHASLLVGLVAFIIAIIALSV